MSDPNQAFPNFPPSNPNGRAEKDGFKASFYPGFVRRLAVRGTDGVETELYDGTGKTFFLPPGFDKPWANSTLEFTRPDGRRIVLQLEDSDQQIERIEIHFKGKGAEGTVAIGELGDLSPLEDPPAGSGGEVLICEDGVVLCPPICPEPEGPG